MMGGSEPARDWLVEVNNLSRRFGSVCALDQVRLQVPPGAVFGLVGANGAGKTTLIRHIIGLLRPQAGSVTVFGRDPVRDPVEVLSRIGYLSETNDLPEWMRVDELTNYTRALYRNWDDEYARHLRDSFELEETKRVKQMSKGQRARLGLLLALAHRPEMLVLDEPSSGLDPLVRRDILRAIIRTISEEGRTVLFSSHLLEEVERVADYVAIIEGGRIVRCGTLDAVKAAFHSVALRLTAPCEDPPEIPGATAWTGQGVHWSAVVEGDVHEFQCRASNVGASIVGRASPSLNEIFVALVGSRHATFENRAPRAAGMAGP